MVAKLVVDREKSVRFLATAVETHGATVAGRVAGRLGGTVTAEGVAALLGAARGLLEGAVASAVAASEAHERELADDGGLLAARDGARDGLFGELVGAREAVSAGWGPAGVAAHGVSGETPRQPDALLALARTFGGTLADGKLELPAARPGVAVDRAGLAGRLSTGATALDQAVKAVRVDRRENEATQDAKDGALAAYDEDFAATAPLVESLFRFAGLRRTADRLVPSARRPGQVEDPDAELPVEEPAAQG